MSAEDRLREEVRPRLAAAASCLSSAILQLDGLTVDDVAPGVLGLIVAAEREAEIAAGELALQRPAA